MATDLPNPPAGTLPGPTSRSASAAQAALLQAALGAPADRLLVSRLSDVVPRESVRDLVASIRAYREAQDEDEDSRAVYLLSRVHDEATAIAWPATSAPPADAPVLVVLPDATGLTELLRLAFNAADHDVENRGPDAEPMLPPLTELAADDVDRLMLEAAAHHLHALITSLVLADEADHTGGVDDRDEADDAEPSSAERSA